MNTPVPHTPRRPSGSTVEDYRFWAFISYSHQDEQWGRWIHRAIERYRVPRKLVGTETTYGAVPRRLFPVFRDRDELASSPDLPERILQALRRSRNLIVVCSPRAANSRWVNEEIRTFKEMGREDRVFCLIVDGTPNVTGQQANENEAFPAAVRQNPTGTDTPQWAEPLAADVRKSADGKLRSKLKLVAGMLGLRFDDLRRRERIRRRWQRLQAAGLAVAVMAATLGIYVRGARLVQEETHRSQSVRLAGASSDELNTQLEVAMLLAVEAFRTSQTSEARGAVLRALVHQQWLDRFLQADSVPPVAVAVSPNGDLIAAGGGGGVMGPSLTIWSTREGTVLARLADPHREGIEAVTFSPDGRILATAGRDNLIVLWDTETFDPITTPLSHPTRERTPFLPNLSSSTPFGVRSLAFSPDGSALISGGGNGTLAIWDVADRWQLSNTIIAHDARIHDVAVNGTGDVLVSATGDEVKSWLLPTLTLRATLVRDPPTPITTIDVETSRDIVAVGFFEGAIRLIELRGGRELANTVVVAGQYLNDVTFSPDGTTLAAAGSEGAIDLIHSQNLQLSGQIRFAHAQGTRTITYGPDGKLVSAGSDNAVGIWTPEKMPAMASVLLEGARFNTVAVDVTTSTVATGAYLDLFVQQIGFPESRTQLTGHGASSQAILLDTEDALVASGGCGTFDTETAWCTDGEIAVWDLAIGSNDLGTDSTISVGPAVVRRAHRGFVSALALNSNRRLLASGSTDSTIIIWESDSLIQRGDAITGHTGEVAVLAFNHEGDQMISGGPDGATLWDLTGGTVSPRPLLGVTEIVNISLAPDDRTVALTSRDNAVYLFDLRAGNLLPPALTGHTGGAISAGFAPDGLTLAVGSGTGQLHLWDLDTRRRIGEPQNAGQWWITAVHFDTTGSRIFSAGDYGTVVAWDFDPEKWIAGLCVRANRNLTSREWLQYMGATPYRLTCPDHPSAEGAPDYRRPQRVRAGRDLEV